MEEYAQKGGFVKRTVIVFAAFHFAVLCAHAWVPEDFYLNNTPLQAPERTEVKLLPSTLRVVLLAGDADEIYVELVPDNSQGTEVLWHLSENNGVAQIYPRGRTCAILAASEGEDNLSVSCDGVTVSIPVSVRKSPEVRVRSFEYEGKSHTKNEAPLKTYRTVVRMLITLGTVLCFGSVFYIINNKVVKRK